LAEDGAIERRYRLEETSTKSYPQRTERNVRESDGTGIFTIGPKLTGGSKKTAEFATAAGKPWLHIRSGQYDGPIRLLDFIRDHKIQVLNIAGSRASKEPEVHGFTKATLEQALKPRPESWIGGPGEG
jgi:hypothetical protein